MRRYAALPPIHSTDYRVEAFPLPTSMERRSRVRFPLDLKVRFQTLAENNPVAGIGSVVNISSGGVLVACEQEISAGTLVELNIEWPALLDRRIPLELIAVGTVVRCETVRFAVGLERYHFRTMEGTDLGIDESCGDASMEKAKKAAGGSSDFS